MDVFLASTDQVEDFTLRYSRGSQSRSLCTCSDLLPYDIQVKC